MAGLVRRIWFFTLVVSGVSLFDAAGGRLAAQSHTIMLQVRGSLTTSAQIYPNPSSLSPFTRNEHFTVEDLTGISAEVQMPIGNGDYAIGLSVEYLSTIDEGTRPIALGGVVRNLPVRDGFFIVPVELSGLAIIPLQTNSIRLTMAGGLGVYFARRILEVAGVGVRPTHTASSLGIHVSVGFDYKLIDGIWAHFETRFRDPDITMEYTYASDSAEFQGTVIPFPSSPMLTRVNVDGMSMAIGVMVEIPAIFR